MMEELIKEILIDKYRANLTWNDLIAALQAVNQGKQTAMLNALTSGNRKKHALMVTRIIDKDINDRATTRAAEMMGDSSLSLAEIQELA